MGADSVSRNAAFAIAARLTTAAITAFVALFLGRKLGPQVYGYFALAMSIGTVSTFLADLGITSATPRFLAERRHHREAVTAVLGEQQRFDPEQETPASYWVNDAHEEDLADVIWRFGEERDSRRIARC